MHQTPFACLVSPGGGAFAIFRVRGMGICQPPGYPRAFATHGADPGFIRGGWLIPTWPGNYIIIYFKLIYVCPKCCKFGTEDERKPSTTQALETPQNRRNENNLLT